MSDSYTDFPQLFKTESLNLPPHKRQVDGDHYLRMTVQPWDIVESWPFEQQVGFFKGNALKYLLRAGGKGDPVTDLDKCIHYIEQLKQTLISGQGE